MNGFVTCQHVRILFFLTQVLFLFLDFGHMPRRLSIGAFGADPFGPVNAVLAKRGMSVKQSSQTAEERVRMRMPKEPDQDAADRRVAAFVHEMRMRGFSTQQVWLALLSRGTLIARRDIGDRTLAARLRMLAHDMAMQAAETSQRQRRDPAILNRWRNPLGNEANDNERDQ